MPRTYVGTTSVGGSAVAIPTTRAIAKRVTIPANSILSSIEAFLHLTDGNQITWRVAVWEDIAGAVGPLIHLGQPSGRLIVGDQDTWIGSSVGRHFLTATPVWIGIHINGPVATTLAFAAGVGSDNTVTSGGTWTAEPGHGSVTVAATTNDHSIRGEIVGPVTATSVGTSTIGASWQGMGSLTYVQKTTIPAGLLTEIRAYIRHDVANIPNIGAWIFDHDVGLDRSKNIIAVSPQFGNAMLGSAAGRWMNFPIGKLFTDVSTTVWLGLRMAGTGSSALDFAYEPTGAESGTTALGVGSSFFPDTKDMSLYAVMAT